MYLQTLTLTNTRCVERQTINLPPQTGLVVLVGPNGAGKTTVLEAISLLFGGRGILGSDMGDIGRHGTKTWGIYGEFDDGQTAAIGLTGGKKGIKLNGVAAQAEDLATLGSTVALAPRQDRLFHESPSERRAWLDGLTTALIPAHATVTARYRQHLQNRLRLLREGKGGDWLDAEEWQAATWGIQLLQNRLHYLGLLKNQLESATLNLKGAAQAILEEPDPIQALQGKFQRSREIDARMERTHAGPGTLDVEGHLYLSPTHVVPLHQSSSGQHKKFMINTVLAHARTLKNTEKNAPFVLIDELSAHLDAARRFEVLQELNKLNAQVWATDTDEPNLPLPLAHILHISS